MSTGEPFVEIHGGSAQMPVPLGVEIGNLIFAPAITGVDPQTGELAEGYEGQLRQALRNMETMLEGIGASLDNVGHVTIFMRDIDGHPVVNKVWPEFFPDPNDRPPHIYIPGTAPEGLMIQVQAYAVRGARRTVLEIPGLSHQDPMSMGCKIGNLVFSSRLFGTEPGTGRRAQTLEEHAEITFGNIRRLLEQAGATPANLVQITAFIADASARPLVERHVEALVDGAAQKPALHFAEVQLGGGTFVRAEIIAAL